MKEVEKAWIVRVIKAKTTNDSGDTFPFDTQEYSPQRQDKPLDPGLFTVQPSRLAPNRHRGIEAGSGGSLGWLERLHPAGEAALEGRICNQGCQNPSNDHLEPGEPVRP